MANHSIGLLLLIIGVGCPCWCLPPRIDVPSEHVVDLRQDDSFSLRCEGSEPLHWNWTEVEPPTTFTITEAIHTRTDYSHISTLTVTDPFIDAAGFYYCFYDGATHLVTDTDNVASTYVYVYDGEYNFIISGFQHIAVSTADKLIMDCRTTLPNITVDLTKDSEAISTALWDPKIGFVMRNLAIQDGGYYTCSIDISGNEKTFIVDITPQETSIPEPVIEWEPNQHFVVGHAFKLNCSVIVDHDIAFHWTIPNSKSNHSTSKSIATRMGSQYRIGTLHMYNASLNDSGEYKCKITSSQKTPSETVQVLRIEETLKPYVNITSVYQISIKEGVDLMWKSGIRAFPANPTIIYRDWRKQEIKETDRITTQHLINNGESWLLIDNITAEEFGNYTIEAFLFHEQEVIKDLDTVLIEVKSKPYPSLKGIPSSVEEGKILEAYCNILGFPLPSTIWTFKSCPDGELDCNADYVSLVPQDEEQTQPLPGNVINASVSFYPEESGLLRCEAENEHGLAHDIVPVSISDIGGNFVFRYIGEDVTVDVESENSKLDVVVNDKSFELLCGTTKFSYKNASLTFPSIDLQTSHIETKLSRKNYASATKVTFDFVGEYICSAHPHGSSSTDKKKLSIQVLEEEPVEFVNANMHPDGNNFVLTENEPFYLNCTVSGTPSPKISWYKDGEPLLPDSPFFDKDTVSLSDNLQSIYFMYVFKEEVGTYSCTAENRLNKKQGYLTITAPSDGLSTGGIVALGVSCLGIVILVIVVVYLVKRVKKERKFRKSFRQNELYLFEKGNIGELNPDCTAEEQAGLLPYDSMWEVNRNDIKIGKQLGSGAFGRVVKASVDNLEDDKPSTTVAVKMCKSQADQSQVRALALELKIMLHLGKHLNIVNLMGANTINIGKGELWILVEYCRFGNLLVFMQRHRNKFINQIDPTTGNIDISKVTPDAITSPLSPSGRSSVSRGYQTAPILDQDGYLAPSASKFSLASPPTKRNTPSPPQSPTSATGSSNGSFRSDGGIQQHVDNPMYNMALQRSVSENPDGGQVSGNNISGSQNVHVSGKQRLNSITHSETGGKQRLNSITHSETGGKQRTASITHSDTSRKQRLNSTTHSDTGSIGYCRENLQVTNTDMTILQSNMSHLSPLSPTDSNPASDMGIDSKGNPFIYDAGIVPAVTAPFTTSDLVCWAWQVAQGMDYLSQRKVLHGDLAARNILLSHDNVIKISDFGLSREMYKKDVYMKKGDDLMPIKWMALEAIRDRIFSVQSDVWAYGVAMWEIFTLGSTPYPGIEVNKDFLELLENGHRMDRPKYANAAVYDILLSCWESDPIKRPTFAMAAERLGVLMLPDLRGQYMTMNDPYLQMNEERFTTETDYLNMLSSPDFEHITKDEETQIHYVNIGDIPDGDTDSNYLNMKSPTIVGYSRVGINSNAGMSNQIAPTTPAAHYLSMGSTQGTPSPMIDVFSPRPNEISRFNFGQQGQENSVRLTELVEEDECASQTQSRDVDDLATERSSLIDSNCEDSSREDITSVASPSSANDQLQNEPEVEGHTGNDSLLYVNLPTHGADHQNL